VRNVDQVVQSLNELLHLLVILTILSAIGSIMIGFVLASRALVPIERSWERQRQFVADASHELRTPIMAVQTRTELLLHHPEQSIEEASPRILAMYKELRRASRLLEDLLTLSRVDSNSQQIVKQEVDVAAVLREVVDMVQPLCEQKGLQLLLHAPEKIMHAVDEARFSQMLFIFVDNAMKYNREGGKINITLMQHKRLELVIEDTGIGIEESEIPRIFDRFYRADKARSHEGTGLGLSIAKFIIEAHEATVRVKSSVGIGTNITISFP
jgi:signal transduction histidine kinase